MEWGLHSVFEVESVPAGEFRFFGNEFEVDLFEELRGDKLGIRVQKGNFYAIRY